MPSVRLPVNQPAYLSWFSAVLLALDCSVCGLGAKRFPEWTTFQTHAQAILSAASGYNNEVTEL